MKQPDGRARLTGAIQTVRGTYEFQGREFDIRRGGSVRFQGQEALDPFLSLTAARTISGVEARVSIGGSLKEPALTLSSSPPLDTADILAMIVFNQPLNQLGSRQRVSLAQRAGALAAELLTAPLSSEITHALGLDRFEIGARATGAGVAPMVTVGEQIGERVFVKFTQQLGPQDLSEFVLELRLADYLRLQTSLSEGSNLVCIPVSSPGVRHVRRSDRRRGVQE